jgi:hypothetical protein
MREKFVAPGLNLAAYHCPHCEVYAHQRWDNPFVNQGAGFKQLGDLAISFCEHCGKYALWVDNQMVFPNSSIAPLPANNMPKEVERDYMEARSLVSLSPRAAAALLRLAIQKLTLILSENHVDLNSAIGDLVKEGLPVAIQEALDCVRVIGNNAVHPGELDLKDDKDTAVALFDLVNMIVEFMVTKPKEVKALYDKIPKGAKDAIAKRDDAV